jgi:hypothetical protein
MPDGKTKRVVAYAPFKTFLSAIELMERHIPIQVDSSLWPSYSGAIRSQLLNTFRFLGLIDFAGKPTSNLRAFVQHKDDRRQILRGLLEASYAPVIGLGLEKVTPRQFREAMDNFGGMGGVTQKKATSFFLNAAKYAGLPMSPLLGRRRDAAPRRVRPGDARTVQRRSERRPRRGAGTALTRSVDLQNGGKLTLFLTADILDLHPNDRAFVFEIIDKLKSYAARKKSLTE